MARERFYKAVSVAERAEGFAVLLDGKSVLTPAKRSLVLPSKLMAHAVAAEWEAQHGPVQPGTMPLTKLANTAIDGVAGHREAVIAQIVAFGMSDLICYRAEGPAELVGAQAQVWDPLLTWARERHGIVLTQGEGIGYITQPPEVAEAIARAVSAHNHFALSALASAAALTGSTIIALAIAGRRLDAGAAFKAAQIDEIYQAERWGKDSEAEARNADRRAQLEAAALFLDWTGQI